MTDWVASGGPAETQWGQDWRACRSSRHAACPSDWEAGQWWRWWTMPLGNSNQARSQGVEVGGGG